MKNLNHDLRPNPSFIEQATPAITNALQNLGQRKTRQKEIQNKQKLLTEMGFNQATAEYLSYQDDKEINQFLLNNYNNQIQKNKKQKLEEDELLILKKIEKNQKIILNQKLKIKYPDFDKILSSKNLQQLQRHHPQILNDINKINDYYTRKKTAYIVIKNLQIADKTNKKTLTQINQKAFSKKFSYPIVEIGIIIIIILLSTIILTRCKN